MPDYDGWALSLMFDHGGNIRREIVQRQICHGACARANAARLRPQNSKTFLRKQPSDDGVIFGAPPQRRQDDDDWAASLRNHFDVNFAPIHHEMLF
jgi:hypothetical protein